MGLLEEELKEIRQTRQYYRDGNITTEQLLAIMVTMNESDKVVKSMIKIHANRRLTNKAIAANLIGNGTAIDLISADPENELVKCPGLDFELIKRHQCLDYSGENKFPECPGCELGLITKKMLLDK